MLIATVFLRMVFFCLFFLWFSSKLTFLILFFKVELVKNYSYNMWEKHCNFPRKLLWIFIVFFSTWFFSVSFVFFFLIFFPKIIFVNFIFLILSWLEFNFVIQLNHVEKHCSFPHKTLWIARVSLNMVFFFLWFFQNYLSILFF